MDFRCDPARRFNGSRRVAWCTDRIRYRCRELVNLRQGAHASKSSLRCSSRRALATGSVRVEFTTRGMRPHSPAKSHRKRYEFGDGASSPHHRSSGGPADFQVCAARCINDAVGATCREHRVHAGINDQVQWKYHRYKEAVVCANTPPRAIYCSALCVDQSTVIQQRTRPDIPKWKHIDSR